MSGVLTLISASEYDRAYNALEAERARLSKVIPLVKEKHKAYEGISRRLDMLEKRIKNISVLIREAKEEGVDVAEEEKAYRSVDAEAVISQVESLFREDKFPEADKLLSKLEDQYEDLDRKITDASEEWRNVADKLTLLSKSLLEITDLVSKCRRIGVGAEDLEGSASQINVDELRERAKKRCPLPSSLSAPSSRRTP